MRFAKIEKLLSRSTKLPQFFCWTRQVPFYVLVFIQTIIITNYNSWNYSNEMNELSREQQLSTIMLLEKKGKSTEHLNNLRPITLTNCDVKLTTKSFANRMSKVMPEVIHESQTGYIPGWYVQNNITSLDLIKIQVTNGLKGGCCEFRPANECSACRLLVEINF